MPSPGSTSLTKAASSRTRRSRIRLRSSCSSRARPDRRQNMPSDRVHLAVDDARALGERYLRGIGYDHEEARIVTDHVIDAALCGYAYSGLAKLLNIPEH